MAKELLLIKKDNLIFRVGYRMTREDGSIQCNAVMPRMLALLSDRAEEIGFEKAKNAMFKWFKTLDLKVSMLRNGDSVEKIIYEIDERGALFQIKKYEKVRECVGCVVNGIELIGMETTGCIGSCFITIEEANKIIGSDE